MLYEYGLMCREAARTLQRLLTTDCGAMMCVSNLDGLALCSVPHFGAACACMYANWAATTGCHPDVTHSEAGSALRQPTA